MILIGFANVSDDNLRLRTNKLPWPSDTLVDSVASLWRVIAGPLYPPTPKRCYQRLDPAKVEEDTIVDSVASL